jgi:hypothetical protein
VLDGERLAVITATTPLLMAVLFGPDAKHTIVPTPALQLSVVPVSVRADPEAKLSDGA